jgi:membrane carboxypeptidase/penicillin-binding protein
MGDAEKNSAMDGAYGGTYCAPMWAKFFAAALKDQKHPAFVITPWTFSAWHGKMQAMSPSASPSASASATPTPGPTKTIKPTVQPTPTPTTPKPTPTEPQPTPTTPAPTPTVTPTGQPGKN